MKRFYVVAAYIGECCTQAHLWGQVVEAPSLEEAKNELRRIMVVEGLEPGDVDAMPLPIN